MHTRAPTSLIVAAFAMLLGSMMTDIGNAQQKAVPDAPPPAPANAAPAPAPSTHGQAPAAQVPAAPASQQPGELAPAGSKVEEGAQHLARGNAADAITAYTEALKDTGLANDRRASILNDRAVAYAKTGQGKLALEDFNKAVQLFSEYPAAYNNRGNLLIALNQFEEAIKDFDRAVLLAPGYAAAYANRANAKLKLGYNGEAVRDFTKAIELMPQAAAPLSGRGLAHLSAGKPHAAIRDFSRAVNNDARFAAAYRNRAEARLDVGQKDQAIEDLSRAAAFDINNAELYIVRGYAYLNAGNTESAIKDFTRAIELDARSGKAYEARGLANGVAEAYEEAYADFNRAIEIDPRSANAFAFRAFVYKQNQQIDVAQNDVETALKLDSSRAEVQWSFGEIEEARGRTDTAISAMRKAISLSPGWKLAEDGLKRLGAGADFSEDQPVAGAGIATWRVVVRQNSYFALSDDFPALRIPLEMMGEGQPKLLEWELKKAPYKGYGVLRFSAGKVAGKSGPEDTEQAAIIDIENIKVVAIQPQRLGQRVASWTWEGDRVLVASVDGVTDEFTLRAAPAEAPVPVTAPAKRYAAPSGQGGGAWTSWNDPLGLQRSERRDQRKQAAKRTYPKPKSIFDLLFN